MGENNRIIEVEAAHTSGVYGKRDVAIVRGQGALLWDADGHEYIDCAAGHGVANIGHGRTEIAAVLAAQAQRLITCPEIVYNDVRAQLLQKLSEVTPPGLEHFFLCNSGTEAVEGALKFARLATGRTGIVATLRGFHGRTMGALSATWEKHYRAPFAPLVPDVQHIRYNDLSAAENAITENTAAVLIELVQAEGGVHVGQTEYVQGLARLCRERGAMLIVDEVQTGFGRTGKLFACEHYDLSPDILCMAKSLAGGVPIGAIGLGPRVMESGRITKGVHGSTFGGNPLACAAALETLAIFERESLAARADRLGAHALERLRTVKSPLIREVRGCGLLIGVELTRRVQPYLEALLARGVLALPAGPNVLRLLPPLVISEIQLERALDIIAEVLSSVPLTITGRSLAASGKKSPAYYGFSGSPEVALLRSMLTITSHSGQEGVLAQYLVEQARLLGLFSYVDEVGNFIASTHEEVDGQEPIVLLGHMDTVAGNISVRVEDDLLYGRGAVDAKGPLATFIQAASRFTGEQRPARPIVVVGAVEEEAATSRGARGVLQRYRPSACIIGEPSSSLAVTIGYKGRLLVHGSVQQDSSHSAGPQQSCNEIASAFWERARSAAEQWNAEHAGNSAFAALQPSLREIQSAHDGLTESTHFVIGYRLPPDFDSAALRAQLLQWAAVEDIQLAFSGEEVAFQTTRTTPLARAFNTALRAIGQPSVFKYKTGTSDMNVVGPVWGSNIVAYGPGDSRLDHTPQEHIQITEYLQAIAILEHVLRIISA
jgi:acetylornithine and succinylornithine aminotransferases/N-acetyl-ornithine/N-acetyl-lysine deacetylase